MLDQLGDLLGEPDLLLTPAVAGKAAGQRRAFGKVQPHLFGQTTHQRKGLMGAGRHSPVR